MADEQAPLDDKVQFRANSAEKRGWEARAVAAGFIDASDWYRVRLNQPDTPGDAEFLAAVQELKDAHGAGGPAEIIRMSVMAALRRHRAERRAFVDAPTITGVASPPEPAGTGRSGRQGRDAR